jgi:hypothetical protein
MFKDVGFGGVRVGCLGKYLHVREVDRRKLHNEELHNLYSLNIIRMIRSRRMRWAGHVERMGLKFIQGRLEGENHMEDLV